MILPDNSNDIEETGIKLSLAELIRLRLLVANGLWSTPRRGTSSLAGPYRSPFRGRGMEFEEVREYQPGDDMRSIDWKVTARTGRPHTKLFREERKRPVYFLMDMNPTMAFGSRVCFKFVAAARMMALAAWSAVQRKDLVGGVIFSLTGIGESRPQDGERGVLPLLHHLCALQPTPRQLVELSTGVSPRPAMERLRRVIRPGGMLFIISDFLAWDQAALNRVAAFARHHHVVMILVYDILESELPAGGGLLFSNGRHQLLADTSSKGLQFQFQEHFQQRRQKLATFCHSHGILFSPLTTHQPVGEFFHGDLSCLWKGGA